MTVRPNWEHAYWAVLASYIVWWAWGDKLAEFGKWALR